MKKALLLFLSAAAILVAGCDKKENEAPFTPQDENFKGTMEVIQDDQSVFTAENVVLEITVNDDSTIDMMMKEVKFSSLMPITLDMTVKGISYIISEDEMIISGTDLIPWAMGGEFPNYIITGLTGTITEETISFSLTCGVYPMTYTGIKD